MTNDDRAKLLIAAGVCFDPVEDGMGGLFVNLNDALSWACADCEEVPPDEIENLYKLFYQFGHCGVLYWVSQRPGDKWRTGFEDVKRKVAFVANEMRIRALCKSDSEYAYRRDPT